jgi:alkanesulfonate monooxygenase SsuD/methylene tetrahydromethanopterin reductase-like flavin-dependent oxidoreductase (luciferase family)
MASGGFILAIHHPVRLAEQAANLDVLSGGRFVCGVVLGYFGGDFGPFGVRVQERAGRLTESIEIMRRLWTGERVTYRGRYYVLEDVFTRPRPLRPSGPPIWIAAKVDNAIRRAAALGDGWFLSADDTFESVHRKIGVYRDAARAGGKPAGEIVLMRDGFVADSAQAARRIAETPMLGLFEEYHAWKKDSPDADRYDSSFEGALPKLVLGSPQQCVDQVGRYRALGVDTLIFRCQYAGISHRDALRSIELFGRHVIPAFPS